MTIFSHALPLNIFLFVILPALIWSSAAHSWNFTGHKIAAQITWGELDGGTRAKVVRIVAAHPLYDADFAQELPGWASDGTSVDRGAWLLQQAAVWPDIVRDMGQPQRREQYNRPKWHYVDRPLFLSDADRDDLEGGLHFNLHMDPILAADPRDMNLFQAITHNLAILRDENAEMADRAVALCWVVHLTQDIHQPNHTMSLVVPKLLPRGDRGGSTIPIKDQGRLRSLHLLWDAMVSEAESPAVVHQIANSLGKIHRTTGLRATRSITLPVWAMENHALAFKYVYTPELLDQILTEENRLLSIDISQDYRTKGRDAARIRIVQAGFRLARLLNEL